MKRLFTMLIVLVIGMTFGFSQVTDDFETNIGDWDDPNFSGSTSGLDASSTFSVSTEQAYAGSSSGKADFIEDTGATGGFFVRMTNRVQTFAPDARIGFWAYTASPDVEFRLVVWDNGAGGDGYEAGPYWSVSAANTWEYFELDLVNDAVTGWITGNSAINSTDFVTIESLQFNTSTDANASVYIDDFGANDTPIPPAVFFSEYIEGGSNNKALEIYNGTGAEIDLANYLVYGNYNGNPWSEMYEFAAGTMVAADDVYVIANIDAVADLTSEADVTLAYGDPWFTAAFNGDDVRGLGYIVGTDTTIIDLIGAYDFVDPGSGWDVAGVTTATANHTLIRKAGVTMGNTDWAASAGTSADDSEWIVQEQDFFGSIGSHPYVPMGAVTFSVNMSFQISTGAFVVGTDVVNVAGTLNDWGGDALADDDADGIYEGTFDVSPGDMEYKFHINGTSWENVANRMFTVVDGENITPTVWFDDQEPVVTNNVEVFIQADMTVQLLNGNFDPDAGDLIVIRGGHANFGDWGGAIQMSLDPEQTNVYTFLSSFDNVPVGSGYEYKFVILTGGDVDAAIWENIASNRSFTVVGDEVDSDENGYGEILQPVAYFSDVTPDDIITQDVTVTFNVDITSVLRALTNGDTLVDTQTGSDDIALWSEVNGVNINGILGQWWDWGNDATSVGAWAMTETADGSMMYSFSYVFTAGQAKSQQYKYGINSLDNENGFGLNRTLMIDDTNPTLVLGMDCFGELNEDPALPFPQICGPMGPSLFFSEYMEGSSNNKSLEIYNGTGAAVSLNDYRIAQSSNGGGWAFYHEFPVDATIADGDVWVMVTDAAFAEMQAVADEILAYPSTVHHNGDDARAIIRVMGTDTSFVDVIGDPNNDPGDGWDVAGVTEATKEHTLVRKADVISGNVWNNSAGTDSLNSEWMVFEQDFYAGLGSHPLVEGNFVTFSVDMNFQITLENFDPDSDFVDVAFSANDWAGNALADDNADGIYEGTFNLPEGAMEYKFRMNANWDTSENLPANRSYTVVFGENILPTVWYSDQEPVVTSNVEVFIQADMTVQLLNGNFDPDAGDLIVIRGAHANFGDWGGAIEMSLDPEQTNVYTHLSSFDNVPVGSGYEYKFVILTGGSVDAAIWENIESNRSFTSTGDEVDSDDNGYGEILQTVAYFSDVTPNDIITQDVTVTFNVDITSVYRALAAGDTLVDTQTGSDDIALWSEVNGVNINGILGQWWDWGNDETSVGAWAMTEIVDGDMMYSFSYLFTAGQAKSQQYKYGINSLDNENGFGLNRAFMIDDANTTMNLEMDCFGELNEDPALPFPQVCGPVSVFERPGIPTSYALSQNYPNPFNPTTSINFDLPEANNVTLTIYNALGQEVRTLKTDYLNAGRYTVTWDGLDNAGNGITSGLYIYRMTSGSHTFSKKMLMLK